MCGLIQQDTSPSKPRFLGLCALIRKARGSGPQGVSVNFSDDVDEFMGCLEPGLAHVLEDVAEALASEDNELSTLEAEIAELSLKPCL